MNKRVTKRLKELFLENRVMPADGNMPFSLKADWRKIKRLYNQQSKPTRHSVLYETIRDL